MYDLLFYDDTELDWVYLGGYSIFEDAINAQSKHRTQSDKPTLLPLWKEIKEGIYSVGRYIIIRTETK